MLVPIEATQLSMALEGMVAALKDQIVQKFETVRGDRQRELGRLISKISNIYILQNFANFRRARSRLYQNE